MDTRNLLILTVYFISVAYVIYRMINSVQQNEVIIEFEQNHLQEQLIAQGIADQFKIEFKLEKRYVLDHLKELALTIVNQSGETTIEVDWDRSLLTDLEKRSRRVIRLPSIPTLDLSLPQMISVIPPGQVLKEKITTEDTLSRDAETEILKPVNPLIKIVKFKPGDVLNFSVILSLRRFPSVTASPTLHQINCRFRVAKLPWAEALRWKPTKKG